MGATTNGQTLTKYERELVVRMYELKAPVAWIATLFGTSRQAIWGMLAKKGMIRDIPPALTLRDDGDDELWDVWRVVVLTEIARQNLEIAEIARRVKPEDNTPKARRLVVGKRERAIYQALRGVYMPRLDTLDAILKGIGKSWGWLEREAHKLKETNGSQKT